MPLTINLISFLSFALAVYIESLKSIKLFFSYYDFILTAIVEYFVNVKNLIIRFQLHTAFKNMF